MNVTLTNHCNEEGTRSVNSWKNTDLVGFFNANDPQPSFSTKSPLSPGMQTSMFMLSSNAKTGEYIVAAYPVSGNTTCATGRVTTKLASVQNGSVTPFFVGKTEYNGADGAITVKNMWCTMYANVSVGNYSIKKAVLTGNNNEKIAGDVTISTEGFSVQATETSVSVEFATAVDCHLKGFRFPICIAPVTFSKGYTVKYITDSGEEFSVNTEDSTVAESDGTITVGGAQGKQSTQLLVCGDNYIYHIDAEIAATKGFSNAVIWNWDAKSVMNVIGKDGLRLDECKPADNNTKILATSSKGFALVLEKETKELLWWSNCSTNAHSIELLPGNRIAVACSEGGDCIQIFNADTPNKVIYETPLPYGHGVLWNEKYQKLFAVGNNTLNIYRLANWETDKPELVLEKSLNMYNKAWGLHDLSYVNSEVILIAGKKAGMYDFTTDTFTPFARFDASTQLKAVNYNIATGESWYVDATEPEGDFTWSSKTIHYTDNLQSTEPDKMTIRNVPFNMYKVRVMHW